MKSFAACQTAILILLSTLGGHYNKRVSSSVETERIDSRNVETEGRYVDGRFIGYKDIAKLHVDNARQ